MKTRLTPLIVLVALAIFSAVAHAQSPLQQERIEASFVLALGRTPTSAEISQWSTQGEPSLTDLIARHRQRIQNDTGLKRAIAIKAGADAFGRTPDENEITASSAGNSTYTELMQRHIQWLAAHPADYQEVLDRAYQRVIHRAAYPGEITYWKTKDTLSYALLVGCIEDWGHRNSPGLMETTGIATVSVNCRFLTTVVLSPAVAAEARSVIAFPAGNPELITASGRNLVAPGAASLATGGRMHFAAAGADDIVLERAGG